MNLKSMKLFLGSVMLMGLLSLTVSAQSAQQSGGGTSSKTAVTQKSGPTLGVAKSNQSTSPTVGKYVKRTSASPKRTNGTAELSAAQLNQMLAKETNPAAKAKIQTKLNSISK